MASIKAASVWPQPFLPVQGLCHVMSCFLYLFKYTILDTGSLNKFCFYDRRKKTTPEDMYMYTQYTHRCLWDLCILNTEDKETNEIQISEISKCAEELPVGRFRICLTKKRIWIPMWRLFDCFAQNLLDCDKNRVEFRCGADPPSLLPLNSLGINGKEGGGLMIRARFKLINSCQVCKGKLRYIQRNI